LSALQARQKTSCFPGSPGLVDRVHLLLDIESAALQGGGCADEVNPASLIAFVSVTETRENFNMLMAATTLSTGKVTGMAGMGPS
jgi:hypothetical protein